MSEEKSTRSLTITTPKDTTSVKKIRYSKTDEPDFYKCTVCGTPYKNLDGNFPASQSELYSGWDYHISTCRKCLDRLFEHYTEAYGGDEDMAIRIICQKYDIYYDVSLLNASRKITKTRSRIHNYISKSNLRQYAGKTFDTTLDEERKGNVIENIDDLKENKSKIRIKTVKFWGTGFTDDDYDYLQEQYDDWTSRHECKTKTQEEVFKRICFKQLEILKTTRAGKDTKELDKKFENYLDTANLKPCQNTNALSDAQTLGTLIKKWENEKPLPDIDPELEDVDKIGLYIDVFFKGHLAKMMGLKNGLSNLYNKFMKKYTVEKPEYKDDENNEALFDAIFGNDEKFEDF